MSHPRVTQKHSARNLLRTGSLSGKSFNKPLLAKEPIAQISVGDMHGNAFKMIHFLCSSGMMQLTPNDFKKLKNIYYKKFGLTKEDFDSWKEILKRANFSTEITALFIGDILADRGRNDYLTLLIFQAMQEKKAPYKITLSNHDALFLSKYAKAQACEKLDEQVQAYCDEYLQSGQERSIHSLGRYLEQGLINQNEIRKIVTESYLTHLILITYTINEKNNGITLFTHAPVGLEVIQKLALKYNVPYQDDSVQLLAATIDSINIQFQKHIQGQEKLSTFCKELSKEIDKSCAAEGSGPVPADYPLARLTWNRYERNSAYPPILKWPLENKFNIKVVHGHTGTEGIHRMSMRGDPLMQALDETDPLKNRFVCIDNEVFKATPSPPTPPSPEESYCVYISYRNPENKPILSRVNTHDDLLLDESGYDSPVSPVSSDDEDEQHKSPKPRI